MAKKKTKKKKTAKKKATSVDPKAETDDLMTPRGRDPKRGRRKTSPPAGSPPKKASKKKASNKRSAKKTGQSQLPADSLGNVMGTEEEMVALDRLTEGAASNSGLDSAEILSDSHS